MLSDELELKLLAYDSYVPVFPQWNPNTNVPIIDIEAKDGVVYELSVDSELSVEETVFKFKRHDLLVRVSGSWELVSIERRNKFRFEKWLTTDGNSKTPPDTTFKDGKYVNKTIQSKWIIWQAATLSTISG